MVVDHSVPEYIGLEGTVSQIQDVLSSSSAPVGSDGELPPFGSQTVYNVQCEEMVGPLTRVPEDWLEFADNVLRRFVFQCQDPPGDYCHNGGICSGCSDRNELIRVVRAQGINDSLSLVFVDLVIKNTARPQTYGQVIHSIEFACLNLLSKNPSASHSIQTWIKADSMWG